MRTHSRTTTAIAIASGLLLVPLLWLHPQAARQLQPIAEPTATFAPLQLRPQTIALIRTPEVEVHVTAVVRVADAVVISGYAKNLSAHDLAIALGMFALSDTHGQQYGAGESAPTRLRPTETTPVHLRIAVPPGSQLTLTFTPASGVTSSVGLPAAQPDVEPTLIPSTVNLT